MGMIGISNSPLRLPHCDACGEMRVIHPLEKFLSWIEERTEHTSFRNVLPYKLHAQRRYSRARFLQGIGIAQLHTEPMYTNDSRVHALFEGAAKVGLRLYAYEVFGKHVSFFLKDSGERVLMFTHLPHELLEYHSPICIDDKYALAKFFNENAISVPQTWCVRSIAQYDELHVSVLPLVTKPCIGTRGRHTTLHLNSKESVQHGILTALQVSTRVVIQEELQGTVYRFTVVGGASVYVGKREYPFVVGDGHSTIAQLVELENTNPIRDGIYFRKMPFAVHEREYLQKKGLSADSVPQKGEQCFVSDKNSRRNGTVVADVTREVHPSIISYVLRAAKLLQSPILGFDVILDNHTIPFENQRGGIIECNSVPYLDVHHRVATGTAYNVAAELFSLVSTHHHLQGKSAS
jgi:D-alanine-D-alanine ligase-like ATP-grasp enzyme